MKKKESLEKLHDIELEMLRRVDALCREMGINYTLCGGSLIGAVRHKGFIPWDDDVDILMPREDYDRFVEKANDFLPEDIRLFNYSNAASPGEVFMHHAVIMNTKTRLRTKWAEKDNEIGVWIDLYPLDGMPGNGGLRTMLHYWHYTFWYVMLQFSWFERTVKLNKPNRPFSERALIRFYKLTHFGKKFDTIKLLYRIDNILRKYPLEGSACAGDLKGSYRKKEIMPKRYWDKTMRVPFETIEVSIPSEYDRILTNFYGDYMTPPKRREDWENRHQFEIVSMD